MGSHSRRRYKSATRKELEAKEVEKEARRLEERAKSRRGRVGRSKSRRAAREREDSQDSDLASDISSESSVSSFSTVITESSSESSSSESETDSEEERRRRRFIRRSVSRARSKSKAKSRASSSKRSKHKSKKRGKRKSSGGGGVGLGSLVLFGAIGALLWSTASVIREGSDDPDTALTYPLPKAVEWSTLPPIKWHPQGARKVGSEMVTTSSFLSFLSPSKNGVVQPRLDSTIQIYEDLVIVGGPKVSPDGNTVCFVGRKRDTNHFALSCIDAESSNVRWTVEITRDQFSSDSGSTASIKTRGPLVLDELVIYPRSCQSLDAFYITDGGLAWSTSFQSRARTCQATELMYDPVRDTVVVATTDGMFVGLNPADGSQRAQVRYLSCSNPASEDPHGCIDSFMASASNTGSFYFKGKVSRSKLEEATQAAKPAASRSWFGKSTEEVPSTLPVSGGVALYHIRLVSSDADMAERFMFRVEKARLLPSAGEHSAVSLSQVRDSVAVSPDGVVVMTSNGCAVQGYASVSLELVWSLDFTSMEPSSCTIQSITVSDEGELYIASEVALYKYLVSDNSAATPSKAWRTSFEPLFDRLYAGEQARVLSSPLLLENGLLLRVGTSRGSARSVVQAGILLVEREDGTFRSFFPHGQISMGDLAVDSFGNVYSGSDDLPIYTRRLLGDSAVYAAGSGGVQVMTALSSSEALSELLKAIANRARNCKSSTSSGWFGRVKKTDEVSAAHDLAHLRGMIHQSLNLAKKLRTESSLHALRSAFEGNLHERSVDYIRTNARYICEAILAAVDSF